MNQRVTTLIDAMRPRSRRLRSVHQARVASRRLREALPVLRASVHQSRLGRVRRQVRRMTRALGPVRELDVALYPPRRTGKSRNRLDACAVYVRQEIARERLETPPRTPGGHHAGKIEKLRQQLGHVATGPETPTPAEATSTASSR
jgi:CHAD domain-containing protein